MARRIVQWLSRAPEGNGNAAGSEPVPAPAAKQRSEAELKPPDAGLNTACPGFEAMILEQVNDAVIALDPGLRILTWNGAAEMIYGWCAPEVIGQRATEIIPGIRYAEEGVTRDAIMEVLRRDGYWKGEVVQPHRDGHELIIDRSTRLMRDERGEPIGTVSINREVTERKRAEQQRIELERKLMETQRLESLGALAGGIAHEFNNLLAVVLGNASLMLLDLPPDSSLRTPVEAIKTSAQHGADLARQMLVYAGKGPSATQRVDLGLLVSGMAGLLKASVRKNIALHCELASGVAPIEADPGQMRQVVMNLILNASEAIGEQQGTITVGVDVMTAAEVDRSAAYLGAPPEGRDYVRLTVADTGRGMDAATRARIFEPFFTTKFIGRGLGLAAVLGIVRSHQGAMAVQSRPGQGTTFTVLLPAVGSPTAEARHAEHRHDTILAAGEEQEHAR